MKCCVTGLLFKSTAVLSLQIPLQLYATVSTTLAQCCYIPNTVPSKVGTSVTSVIYSVAFLALATVGKMSHNVVLKLYLEMYVL